MISLNSQIILSENQKGYYGTTLFPLFYLNLTRRSFGAYIQKIIFRSINRWLLWSKMQIEYQTTTTLFSLIEKISGVVVYTLSFCMVKKGNSHFLEEKALPPKGTSGYRICKIENRLRRSLLTI